MRPAAVRSFDPRIAYARKLLAELLADIAARGPDVSQDALRVARTNLQTGFMWLDRSVSGDVGEF